MGTVRGDESYPEEKTPGISDDSEKVADKIRHSAYKAPINGC